MWWSDSWFSDYWPFPWMMGPLMMMVFFVVCITMMFFMMRRRRHGSADGYPIVLLKERYARGEINQAEFEERRRILES
jgi:putative membrane protein